GSIKSNLGHTQAAAGVAGVIKMVMAMHHGTLPATLHAAEPTPHVDWTAGEVRLLQHSRAWAGAGDAPRRAGISSFGMSGTNAHAVIEAPPAADRGPEETDYSADSSGSATSPHPDTSGADAAPLPYTLSAATSDALRDQARRLLDHLTAHPSISGADLAHSLATTRAHLPHRSVVVAGRS